MRLRTTCFAFLVASVALLAAPAGAQTHLGTDFWTADTFSTASSFTIAIGNPGPGPASISIFNTLEGTTLDTVLAGDVKTYTFADHDLLFQGTITSTDPAYHVTSSQNVAVFVFDPLVNAATNDAMLILPVNTLGVSHRIANFVNPSNSAGQWVGVVASAPGTTNVKILDDTQTVVNNVNLVQGEFFQRINHINVGATPADDMTGWEVLTSLPAAVFSGVSGTSVGIPDSSADAIFEMLLPEQMASLNYVVAPTGTRPIGCTTPATCAADLFRFVATQDNTTVTTTPSVGSALLNEGDYLELATATPFVISGDKPFFAYQYLPSLSAVYGTNPPANTGDPALVNVIPPEHFRQNYIFHSEGSFPNNFINIVTPVGSSLLLDGIPITDPCVPIGTVLATNYCHIRKAVGSGPHTATNAPGTTQKFGLIASGFQTFGSYAYPAGAGMDCSTGADGWMKDEATDSGVEPNPSTAPMWQSEDIWVRTQQDTLLQFEHQHQNPIVGQTNYVYVKLRNRGCSLLDAGQVHTYFTKASTGLIWNVDWINDLPDGDLIGSQPVTLLAPNGTVVLEYSWTPTATGHFCLLARLDSGADPMTFTEGTGVNANTKNNNNIAWKNVIVLSKVIGVPQVVPVIVSNVRPTPVLVDLVFGDAADTLDTSFLLNGTITLELPTAMYDGWQAVGGGSQGLNPIAGTTRFEVVSPFARLDSVPMDVDEEQEILLSFEHSGSDPDDRLDPFVVSQFSDAAAEPDGGVTFVFPRPQESSPPGTSQPLLFTDAVTLEWEDAATSGADSFNLYRGNLASLSSGDFGICLEQDILLNMTTDSSDPAAGVAWTYLVTGEGAGGEGGLGETSDGSKRANNNSCP